METLKEKLGPLPVYGWLILLTAAGLAWWLLSGRKQAAAAAPTPEAAASDVPQTVIQAPVTINQPEPGDEDERERGRKRKATAHKCPHGYHFLAVPKGSDIFPFGGRRVPGGFCVPDDKDARAPIRQPVLPNPRIPRAGGSPTNHEPQAA